MTPSPEQVLAETRAWVERMVIGLNLCPFAKAVQSKGQVRYVYCAAEDEQALLQTLHEEMDFLVATDADAVDTTLIVHPQVLTAFADYNDFLDTADGLLEQLGYDGVLQVASFHPQYQFAETRVTDVSNSTNRSPYPTLHLLREASVDRAVAAFPDPEVIFSRNIRTLEALGNAGYAELMALCKKEALVGD